MEYCPDRKQRNNAYLGNVNRGSKDVDVYLHTVGHTRDVRQHRIDQGRTKFNLLIFYELFFVCRLKQNCCH